MPGYYLTPARPVNPHIGVGTLALSKLTLTSVAALDQWSERLSGTGDQHTAFRDAHGQAPVILVTPAAAEVAAYFTTRHLRLLPISPPATCSERRKGRGAGVPNAPFVRRPLPSNHRSETFDC